MFIKSLFRKKKVADILKHMDKPEPGHHQLARHLGVRDLTAFGIAAIIGAGIFSTIGKASADGGPAVIFLFLFTAMACGFAAFAYAEFASLVPVSGSAYTYSYVAFGELFAWIIGWALIMEYAIGNIVVAISWSDYFVSLLQSIQLNALGIQGIHVPEWATMDYFSAKNGFTEAMLLMERGLQPEGHILTQYLAWKGAPLIGGFHVVMDIPALFIIVLITWLVYRGMKESRTASNIMVAIKLSVVLLIIFTGIFYIDTSNYSPFAPNGIGGILQGVSAVFFAYIGFDAISTTAEECHNPQRDLPKGMMYAIIICTILYVAVALVLTGMVSYSELNVGDPLAFVFHKLGLEKLSGVIGVSAVVAMASVLLVFQMGQPRIWMAMSKDGLLPKKFSRIHPRFKTPGFSTIITGFLVAVPALFMDLSTVADICSIGTLFAFVLVCGGVLRLQIDPEAPRGRFKTPYINSRYIAPVLLILALTSGFIFNRNACTDFVFSRKMRSNSEITESLDPHQKFELLSWIQQQPGGLRPELFEQKDPLLEWLNKSGYEERDAALKASHLPETLIFSSGFDVFKHNIPRWIFLTVCVLMAVTCFVYRLSLIPVLGLLSCLYMMSELGLKNWIGFGVWLLAGLLIYFAYSRKHSKLNTIQVR